MAKLDWSSMGREGEDPVNIHNCARCGMRAFYRKGGTFLCREHGEEGEMENISTDNIRAAWQYFDGVKWCYVYKREDAKSWANEAVLVRVRVLAEYEGEILECEVLR